MNPGRRTRTARDPFAVDSSEGRPRPLLAPGSPGRSLRDGESDRRAVADVDRVDVGADRDADPVRRRGIGSILESVTFGAEDDRQPAGRGEVPDAAVPAGSWAMVRDSSFMSSQKTKSGRLA